MKVSDYMKDDTNPKRDKFGSNLGKVIKVRND